MLSWLVLLLVGQELLRHSFSSLVKKLGLGPRALRSMLPTTLWPAEPGVCFCGLSGLASFWQLHLPRVGGTLSPLTCLCPPLWVLNATTKLGVCSVDFELERRAEGMVSYILCFFKLRDKGSSSWVYSSCQCNHVPSDIVPVWVYMWVSVFSWLCIRHYLVCVHIRVLFCVSVHVCMSLCLFLSLF